MAEQRRVFDYIVVGAGSAGCAIANRLSEDHDVSVALIEAGGKDTDPWIHVPSGYYRNMTNPKITWQYDSGPEPHLGGRMVTWPRGRVLGGSSSINGLLYVRGQANDFNVWRQLGAEGWAFDDVLPYFKKSERQERGGDDYHGGDGPLGVSNVRMDNEICEAFRQAAVAHGIPENDDFNGPRQEGVGYYQLTNLWGRRSSSARAYLKPAEFRGNLDVVTNAMTDAIVLEGKRATGVRITRNGRSERLTARREVILSAGAIGSPQILQVSGIGPVDVLHNAGVPVVHELPGVGENLQDHYQARLAYEINGRGSLNAVWHSRVEQARAGIEYATTRGGILTIGAGVVGVFAKTSPDLDEPDMQIHFLPLSSPGTGQGLHDFPGVVISVCQLRPESRGHLRIRTADTNDHPEIVSNYLSTDTDRHVLLEAMKIGRGIARRRPFADFVVREFKPGPAAQTDEELMQFAKDEGWTIFHPCGTCKMGVDPMAVVDPRLRVRGINGLRVADASIMPRMTSGNTNAPTIMIGEKAADMIKEDRRAGVTSNETASV
ncbi:MAG: choline dehydrogenase [Pseudomonadota bacterium]